MKVSLRGYEYDEIEHYLSRRSRIAFTSAPRFRLYCISVYTTFSFAPRFHLHRVFICTAFLFAPPLRLERGWRSTLWKLLFFFASYKLSYMQLRAVRPYQKSSRIVRPPEWNGHISHLVSMILFEPLGSPIRVPLLQNKSASRAT